MKRSFSNISYRILLLLAACLIQAAPAEAKYNLFSTNNINDGGKLFSNSVSAATDASLACLYDGNLATEYHTASGELGADPYIQLNFKPGATLRLEENEDMVVYVRRTKNDSDPHPTVFRLDVSQDGENWTTLCYPYLLYRGHSTEEFSQRLHPAAASTLRYNYVRLTVLQNNNMSMDNAGHRYAAMAELQIIVLKRTENFANKWRDRFHRTDEVRLDYQNINFINTHGIIDPANHQYSDAAKSWSEWAADWSADGKWLHKEDTKKELTDKGIAPETVDSLFENWLDFTFIESGSDKYGLEPGQQRQRTHVYEHDLYAIAGDPIALNPFYQMTETEAYLENFSHWYDYRTGGRVIYEDPHLAPSRTVDNDLLDFLVDPRDVYYSDKFGYFAGNAMPQLSTHTKEQFDNSRFIFTTDDYINAAKEINGEANLKIYLCEDLDFKGANVTPLGYDYTHSFKGVFDGQGHVIKNANFIASSENTRAGLIGYAVKDVTVRNLTLDESCKITATGSVAGLIACYNGDSKGNLLISNVSTYATVSSDGNSAGLIGNVNGGSGWTISIENCFVGGTVGISEQSTSKANAAIASWIKEPDSNTIKVSNTIVTATAYGYKNMYDDHAGYCFNNADKTLTVTNSYASKGNGAVNKFNPLPGYFPTTAITDEETAKKMSETLGTDNWEYAKTKNSDGTDTYRVVPKRIDNGFAFGDGQWKYPHRSYGTVATFFMPRNPDLPMDQQPSLVKDYVIAADFSNCFNENYNINLERKTITEPVINFRHIFRIHDGVAQADALSLDAETNAAYVKRNTLKVNAREHQEFQIRLDCPVPDKNVSKALPSKYYYRHHDGDYHRICSMDIRVIDLDKDEDDPDAVLQDSRRKIERSPNDDNYFEFSEKFKGQGTRTIDGVEYIICNGTYGSPESYFRMLHCANPTRGRYRIEILGNDVTGAPIKIKHKNSDEYEELVVMCYEVEFVDSSNAWIIYEDELYYDGHVDQYHGIESDVPVLDDNGKEIIIDGKKLTTQGARKKDFDRWKETNSTGDDKKDVAAFYKRFEAGRHENLVDAGGKLVDQVDFDKYSLLYLLSDNLRGKYLSDYKDGTGTDKELNLLPGQYRGEYLKWPLPWNESSYIFGYDKRYEYNAYNIASHSDMTIWHGQVDKVNGLYDRSVYDWQRERGVKQTTGEDGKALAFTPDQLPDRLGFYLYNNAATDPGVMARLNVRDLCKGSSIHVSAWIAELSGGSEAANVAFKFIAVNRETGERHNIHTFVSGYVDGYRAEDIDNADKSMSKDIAMYRGQWQNIYYTFVPDFKRSDITLDTDRYEFVLEIDNNCKNSHGADYALDGIKVYVVKPLLEAKQLTVPCDNENGDGATTVKIMSPFDVLLQVSDMPEAENETECQDVENYYTFIDKSLFDTTYKAALANEEIDDPGAYAYDLAVVRFPYNAWDNNASDNDSFGLLHFKTHYLSNKDYKTAPINDDSSDSNDDLAFFDDPDKNGERWIVLNTHPVLGVLSNMKEYYLSLCSTDEAASSNPGWESFGFLDADGNISDCSKMCVFTISPSVTIKLDGEVKAESDDIKACRRQAPVIQVNLFGRDDENNDYRELDNCAITDWFNGTLPQYKAISHKGVDLSKAMAVMRNEFPMAEDISDLMPSEGSNPLTVDMISLIDMMTRGVYLLGKEGDEKRDVLAVDSPEAASFSGDKSVVYRIILARSSYVFPPLADTETSKLCSVLVLPYQRGDYNDANILLCTNPVPVTVRVDNVSPLLRHGLTGMPYPDRISDVPLRIGLKQLNGALRAAKDFDQTQAASNPNDRLLMVPVRKVTPSGLDENATSLMLPLDGSLRCSPIILVATNDPEYKDLGTLNELGEETGVLREVGQVVEMTADVAEKSAGANQFRAVFWDDFKFKEGYFYSVRFNYVEPPVASGNEQSESLCDGQDVFTLKVVPEYQMWTGKPDADGNLNWNNDANWRRINANDACIADSDRSKTSWHSHLTDAGPEKATPSGGKKIVPANPRPKSYAPLDFTKVIIPSALATDTVAAPELFAIAHEQINDLSYLPGAGHNTFYPTPSVKMTAVSSSDVAAPYEAQPSEATFDIQYDMASLDYSKFGDADKKMLIGCRPWYPYTCEEIHFRAGSEIIGQSMLNYGKAWVDMEMDAQKWQLAASPLQQTFAGDFYLPTDGARQLTEYFQPIEFNFNGSEEGKSGNVAYNRFAPAVYQRGWDKSAAMVYEIVNASGSTVHHAAAWSEVYNDVQENYSGGVGFSVRTDVSSLSNAPSKVLFRFPKADTSFSYHDADDNHYDDLTHEVTKTVHHRLNDASGTLSLSNSGSDYFLAGNPLMAHLDMVSFLKANKDLVGPSVWWMEEGAVRSATIDASGSLKSDSGEAINLAMAPGTAFFVKRLGSTRSESDASAPGSLQLSYEEWMEVPARSCSAQEEDNATRASAASQCFSIAAMVNGEIASHAAVFTDSRSQKGFADAEDVVLLDNREMGIPAMVYTVAGNFATSINTLPDMEGIEIGVLADDNDTPVTLIFGDTSAAAGLMLYDALTDEYRELRDGMTYSITGSAAGRLFITMPDDSVEAATLECRVLGDTVTVASSADGSLQASLYDINGRRLAHEISDGGMISFSPGSGLFIVDARDAHNVLKRKIIIK